MTQAGYDIWHSFNGLPGTVARSYVRQQFRNGELVRSTTETVYLACASDFPRLLQHWNRLGANPSHHGGYHYSYHETEAPESAGLLALVA